MANNIYTIGHSNHSSDTLIRLLAEAKIEVLVDVRSHPSSSWNLYANPRDLKLILKAAGITYLYLGDVLGGRPDDSDCYDAQTGKVDYKSIERKEWFQQGLNRLRKGMKNYRVCIMCAEEDPSSCHRNLLIGESLRRKDIRILHIRGTGRIQTDEDLWKEKTGVESNQLSLPLGGSL